MSSYKFINVNFKSAVDRLKEVTGMTKDVEVASALGFHPVAFAQRKKRASVPVTEIVNFCYRKGVRPEYIFNGTHPIRALPSHAQKEIKGLENFVPDLEEYEYEEIEEQIQEKGPQQLNHDIERIRFQSLISFIESLATETELRDLDYHVNSIRRLYKQVLKRKFNGSK